MAITNYTNDTYTYRGNYNSNQPDYGDISQQMLTSDANKKVDNMFNATKDFRDVTRYRLMRGVPDFGSLVQFNPYETGYAAFIICQMPKFMEVLAKYNPNYNKLVQNFAHIIEYEFKSFSGLQDMNADTIQLGDDLNNINVINKVNMQSASEFELTYDEKSGSPITKFCKLYLTGIKDPRTQVKTYHGLIHSGLLEPGFENEVFTFLFINTDNTMRYVEAAYLLIGCQINSADTDMYNYTKGDINKREVTVKFSGYPISCTQVDECATDMIRFLLDASAGDRQIIINSNDFNYTGLNVIADTMSAYGANEKTYSSIGRYKSGGSHANYTTGSRYISTNGVAMPDSDQPNP